MQHRDDESHHYCVTVNFLLLIVTCFYSEISEIEFKGETGRTFFERQHFEIHRNRNGLLCHVPRNILYSKFLHIHLHDATKLFFCNMTFFP